MKRNNYLKNRGFSIKNSSGEDIIQNVELLNNSNNCNTLKITCKESPANLLINYGFSNIDGRNAGELRDNNNVVYSIDGKDYYLYSWCVIFQYYLG